MKILKPAERLIVAADFKPSSPAGSGHEVTTKVIDLAKQLKDTGVYLKIGSALRSSGYGFIEYIKSFGLKVFADLKLHDTPDTLAIDGAMLREAGPDIVTVACSTGLEAMRALQLYLLDTEVLGVTALTSFTEDESRAVFACSIIQAVERLAKLAKAAHLGGIVASGVEAPLIRRKFGSAFTINAPAIRPQGTVVPGDHQNPARIMTPTEAIAAGVDRVVIGRPITEHSNPLEMVKRTIDEIALAVEQRR